MAGGDDIFYERLDAALTDLIRLARHPRLTERMSMGIDESVDRRLLVLLNLIADRGPLRAADLIDVMAVDQSTVSRQLALLEHHGLVVREADPRDRRAALIAVTAKGRDVMGIARRAWQETLADLTHDWPEERRSALLVAVEDLAVGLGALVPSAVSVRSAT